eukprot:TRINITY_DN91629_c0_g1_i1.p1 TRINITY_DN91629_c0_g1~~TRINITY_DN91629_c0_g1_i1.p1  ORF type:complete len:538 (-),score=104.98 TRINITY_DN91629_c0_g1_i1:19-1530(-)
MKTMSAVALAVLICVAQIPLVRNHCVSSLRWWKDWMAGRKEHISNVLRLRTDPSDSLFFFMDRSSNLRKASLKLMNPLNEQIAFRLKTSAPGAFAVKPAKGTLEPGGEETVWVTMKSGQSLSEVSTKSFLVQAVKAPEEAEALESEELWQGRRWQERRSIVIDESDEHPAYLLVSPVRGKLCFEQCNKVVQQSRIKLSNDSKHRIAFRIQVTQRGIFQVTPANGILLPESHIEVCITPQPSHSANSMATQSFLIQAAVAAGEEPFTLDKLSKLPKAELWQRRLDVEVKERVAKNPVDVHLTPYKSLRNSWSRSLIQKSNFDEEDSVAVVCAVFGAELGLPASYVRLIVEGKELQQKELLRELGVNSEKPLLVDMLHPAFLHLEPNDGLTFSLGSDGNFCAEMLAKNDSSVQVAFRMMSTAPALFGLKPSKGVLPPGSSQKIEIVYFPAENKENKNDISLQRFQIRSIVPASDDPTAAYDELASRTGGKVFEQKIGIVMPGASK